jgi:FixJ family two-component response regulator
MVNGIARDPDEADGWCVVAILDDDHAFREALAGGIGSFGYEVVELPSPEALFEFLPRPGLACLVLDYDLPGQNGLEVQAVLAEREPDLPIVFLSACMDDRVSRAALAAGAVAFLTKPTRLKDLAQIIRTLVTEDGEPA